MRRCDGRSCGSEPRVCKVGVSGFCRLDEVAASWDDPMGVRDGRVDSQRGFELMLAEADQALVCADTEGCFHQPRTSALA